MTHERALCRITLFFVVLGRKQQSKITKKKRVQETSWEKPHARASGCSMPLHSPCADALQFPCNSPPLFQLLYNGHPALMGRARGLEGSRAEGPAVSLRSASLIRRPMPSPIRLRSLTDEVLLLIRQRGGLRGAVLANDLRDDVTRCSTPSQRDWTEETS